MIHYPPLTLKLSGNSAVTVAGKLKADGFNAVSQVSLCFHPVGTLGFWSIVETAPSQIHKSTSLPDTAAKVSLPRFECYLSSLTRNFLAHKAEAVGTPKGLALRMTHLAHMILNLIASAFEKETKNGSLHAQLPAFRDNLIPDLSVEQFTVKYCPAIIVRV